MHSRDEKVKAKNLLMTLMGKVVDSSDAIDHSQRSLAQKISSTNFSGLESLTAVEIDDLIDLIGNYLGDEEEITTVLIDMLLDIRHKNE